MKVGQSLRLIAFLGGLDQLCEKHSAVIRNLVELAD